MGVKVLRRRGVYVPYVDFTVDGSCGGRKGRSDLSKRRRQRKEEARDVPERTKRPSGDQVSSSEERPALGRRGRGWGGWISRSRPDTAVCCVPSPTVWSTVGFEEYEG